MKIEEDSGTAFAATQLGPGSSSMILGAFDESSFKGMMSIARGVVKKSASQSGGRAVLARCFEDMILSTDEHR